MSTEMVVSIEDAINRAAIVGQRLEDLVFNKVKDGGFVIRTERDDLLLGYWSLIFDYCKGIACLLHNKLYSAAFALLRPTIEATVRSFVVKMGTEERRAENQARQVQGEIREGRVPD